MINHNGRSQIEPGSKKQMEHAPAGCPTARGQRLTAVHTINSPVPTQQNKRIINQANSVFFQPAIKTGPSENGGRRTGNEFVTSSSRKHTTIEGEEKEKEEGKKSPEEICRRLGPEMNWRMLPEGEFISHSHPLQI